MPVKKLQWQPLDSRHLSSPADTLVFLRIPALYVYSQWFLHPYLCELFRSIQFWCPLLPASLWSYRWSSSSLLSLWRRWFSSLLPASHIRMRPSEPGLFLCLPLWSLWPVQERQFLRCTRPLPLRALQLCRRRGVRLSMCLWYRRTRKPHMLSRNLKLSCLPSGLHLPAGIGNRNHLIIHKVSV